MGQPKLILVTKDITESNTSLNPGELGINRTPGEESIIFKTTDNQNVEMASKNYVENTVNTSGFSQFIVREITSDSDGLIAIPEIEGYSCFNVVSFDNGKLLNCIRFGDNIYVGYYGGSALPNTSTAVTVMFTTKAQQVCKVYYIKTN